MTVLWILLLAVQFRTTSCQTTIGWLNVDCGNDVPRIGPNLLLWGTDEDLTKFGINKRVPERQTLEEMSTVRFFPNQADQNCYTLPVCAQTLRYLIRAGFYYGNYDGLSNFPTFDLYIDNKKWSTVNTSSIGRPIYAEALHTTNGSGSINVCMRQIRKNEIPFISSLEIVPLWVNLYPQMESNFTFSLINRINYGGNEVRYSGILSEEKYNRIWTQGAVPPNCIVVPTLPDSTRFPIPENEPPNSVLSESIASSNTSTPIILSVDLPTNQVTPQTAYFVFYFTVFTEQAKRPSSNDTRIIDIYIDGRKRYTVAAEVNKCKLVTLYPVSVVGPKVNITLVPANSSTLAPMISAMEVFSRIDLDPAHGNNTTGGTQNRLISSYFILILAVIALINTQ